MFEADDEVQFQLMEMMFEAPFCKRVEVGSVSAVKPQVLSCYLIAAPPLKSPDPRHAGTVRRWPWQRSTPYTVTSTVTHLSHSIPSFPTNTVEIVASSDVRSQAASHNRDLACDGHTSHDEERCVDARARFSQLFLLSRAVNAMKKLMLKTRFSRGKEVVMKKH